MVVRSLNYVKNIHIQNATLKLGHKSTNTFWMNDLGNSELMSLEQSIISSVISFSKEKSTITRLNALLELSLYQFGFHFES